MLEAKPGRQPFTAFHARTLETLVRTGSYEAAASELEFPDGPESYPTLWVACCVIKAVDDLVDSSPMLEALLPLYHQRLLEIAQ